MRPRAPASTLRGWTTMNHDRGIGDTELMDGARRSTMEELASATVEADKVDKGR
jgi:sulfur relay (sulfurtransferase) complex TusBCD TusD component (DsrE family)